MDHIIKRQFYALCFHPISRNRKHEALQCRMGHPYRSWMARVPLGQPVALPSLEVPTAVGLEGTTLAEMVPVGRVLRVTEKVDLGGLRVGPGVAAFIIPGPAVTCNNK